MSMQFINVSQADIRRIADTLDLDDITLEHLRWFEDMADKNDMSVPDFIEGWVAHGQEVTAERDSVNAKLAKFTRDGMSSRIS